MTYSKLIRNSTTATELQLAVAVTAMRIGETPVSLCGVRTLRNGLRDAVLQAVDGLLMAGKIDFPTYETIIGDSYDALERAFRRARRRAKAA
jgi:LPS sulfotransferase NodH